MTSLTSSFVKGAVIVGVDGCGQVGIHSGSMAERLGCSGVYSREVFLGLFLVKGGLGGSIIILIQDSAGKLVDVTVTILPHLVGRCLRNQMSGLLHYSYCAGELAH
jgi:hypothetical protein